MTELCVSIIATEVDAIRQEAAEALSLGADILELRLDMVKDLPADMGWLDTVDGKRLGTLRSSLQGGRYSGIDRIPTLQRIAGHLDLIDLEEEDEADIDPGMIVRSYHDLRRTPEACEAAGIVRRMWERGRVAKAAFTVRGAKDLLSILDTASALRGDGKEFALMGMGELGALTRVADLGSSIVYCSLPGRPAAPGQLDIGMMRRSFGGMLTGLIGHPLSHSLSYVMQNAAFRESGVRGAYLNLPTRGDELEDMIEVVGRYRMRGVNVTIPHKEAVIQHLDGLAPSAAKVGAVNTVVAEGGTLIGHNTDVAGLRGALRGVELSDLEALVIGAGGVARAACALLREEGAGIAILNRHRAKAVALAQEFGGMAVDEAIDCDLVINCTPLGMKGFPSALPVPGSCIRKGMEVMDTVYNPVMTPLLSIAKEKGANVHSGLEMLIHQGAEAFRLWTGIEPNIDVMRDSIGGMLE